MKISRHFFSKLFI